MTTTGKGLTSRQALVLMGTLGVGIAGLAMLRGPGPASSFANPAPIEDRWASLPPTLEFRATIRDFRGKNERGGHADFEAYLNSTARVGLVRRELDADGKPVLASTTGLGDITREFLDSAGRPIPPIWSHAAGSPREVVDAQTAPTDARLTSFDDAPGVITPRTGPQITSAEGFAQWYRDVPGVNASVVIPLTLRRQPNTSMYVFDSARDEPWKSRGGFFPINGDLYGNFGSTRRNYHFTTELEADFVYQAGQNQVFHFTGDDDVWVFIDNKLVLDLGGLHPRREQYLELDRVPWLEDGALYTMKLFHAERHTTESNFRIATSIRFRSVEPPPATLLGD